MYVTPVPGDPTVTILLVEDNDGDQLLTKKALGRTKLAHDLYVVSDGVHALDFVFQRGEYAHAPRPDLVLLDLNLPRVDGVQVLAELKHDPVLRRIPVIVLTSSAAESDIVTSFTTHANSYMVKPGTPDELAQAMSSLGEFWFTHSRLATR